MPPKIIAHRGNLIGPDYSLDKHVENNPKQIEHVLETTPYDIEIDVWYDKKEDTFYLGHDKPIYPIKEPVTFLSNERFWIHAKNFAALSKLLSILPHHINVFSHDQDPVVLTSTRIPWVYPGKDVDENSIVVMPELTPKDYTIEQLKKTRGICTDYPQLYENLMASQTCNVSNLDKTPLDP